MKRIIGKVRIIINKRFNDTLNANNDLGLFGKLDVNTSSNVQIMLIAQKLLFTDKIHIWTTGSIEKN